MADRQHADDQPRPGVDPEQSAAPDRLSAAERATSAPNRQSLGISSMRSHAASIPALAEDCSTVLSHWSVDYPKRKPMRLQSPTGGDVGAIFARKRLSRKSRPTTCAPIRR